MLRQNPELMRSMLNTMNPQLANNPRMQEVKNIVRVKGSNHIFVDADQRLARNDQSSCYPSSRSGECYFIYALDQERPAEMNAILF